MTDLRSAAKQALEALEICAVRQEHQWHGLQQVQIVKAALRAALEQPEQEPVAWQWLNTAHFRKKLPADAEPGAWNPLYTHPPRREALEQPEQEVKGCDHCNHPLYAAIKCRVCGRVRAETQRDELLQALKDATDAIEHWGTYATDYFQKKWDLHSDINAARAAIARAEGQA
jgi:hypothetical protein